MDHIPVHFDIPAEKPEVLAKFYGKLFGWRIERSEGPVEYWLIYTSTEEGKGMGGGIGKKEDPNQRPINYILVESVDEYSRKVENLGGKITVPKQEIPGVGYLAVAIDPEGNVFGLLEAISP